MAKQRVVNTKFWSDNFIVNINPLDRYLFIYFLTNEKTELCGVYELPLRTIAYETGIDKDNLLVMFKTLEPKVYYIDGWVYLPNFSKHQQKNPSIEKGKLRSMGLVPEKILNKINEIEQTVTGSDSLRQIVTPKLKPKLKLKPKGSESTKVDTEDNKFTKKGAEVLKLFEKINPACSKYYGRAVQRQACDDLIKLYGFERVALIIEKTLPKTNKMTADFFPNISTPLQLFEKWQRLEDQVFSYQKKRQKLSDNIAFQ